MCGIFEEKEMSPELKEMWLEICKMEKARLERLDDLLFAKQVQSSTQDEDVNTEDISGVTLLQAKE